MAVFTEPEKFSVLPGSAADTGKIQSEGSTLNPSLVNLFPAIYQLALAAGGKAPERTTFNEFLRLILQRLYYIERGGVWSYDATADYPAGAVVGYSGSLYLALKDNGESTDAGAVQPDADGEVWQKLETAADLAKVLLGYLPVATAEADYLKKSDASHTYLSKSDAEDTYQTKEDLSSQIITSVRSNWYATYPDGAEAHNAMWGGRDITAAFDAGTVSEHIADGTFKDIFPGDYITKQVTISGTAYTVNWVITDCDYWINKGDTATTAHHVVIVPQAPIFNANMNNDNVTTGGYAGSRMYRETIPACATGIFNAIESSHILTFRDSITTAVNTSSISSGAPFWTGASSDWGWYDAQCNLMCERMVYGCPRFPRPHGMPELRQGSFPLSA
ncbi:hypothetical protein [Enterococcus faecium]|uniref:hypothetical protein n=1 Tax=Enterococcus faecium TaxID=1352 RepID=UPI003DA2B4BA